MKKILVRLAILGLSGGVIRAAELQPENTPIVAVVPDLNHLQKWDEMQGDTADPFWAEDDNLYHFTCDGRGFGKAQRNLCFNQLTGPDLLHLTGKLVNSMDDYGKSGDTGADGATWKVTGQECIDGIFYAFVVRNVYGNKSKDPLRRQTSFNASLIKSSDHGLNWTRGAKENYDQPMWPGHDSARPASSIMARTAARHPATAPTSSSMRSPITASGMEGMISSSPACPAPICPSSTPPIGPTTPVVTGLPTMPGPRPSQGQTHSRTARQAGLDGAGVRPGAQSLFARVVVCHADVKAWFTPERVVYDFFEAGHPWGPWTFVSSFDDRFLMSGQHMYGPNLCAKYQESDGTNVNLSLFTSGCPFADERTGLYKNWRIPLTLRTQPLPRTEWINDNNPAIRYSGLWRAGVTRAYQTDADLHDYEGDVHYSNHPGDEAELTFTGTGIELRSEKAKDQGEAEVFLDGQAKGRVNLRVGDFPRLAQIPVFSAQDLVARQHIIRIVNTSSNYITLDAFVVSTGPAAK